MGISADSLERHCLSDQGMSFADFYELKRGHGKMALRRKQMQIALAGNVAMLIFLGKNYLDQKDRTEVTGNMNHKLFDGQSTDELEKEIARLENVITDKNQN